MLSLQVLRERTDEVRRACAARGVEVPLDRIIALDGQRRALLQQVETMRADRNQASKRIGVARDAAERQRLIEEQRGVGGRLDALEQELAQTQAVLDPLLLEIPNLFHPSIPIGDYDAGVIVEEGHGERVESRPPGPRPLAGEPPAEAEPGRRPHWELGEQLGIIDFERGVKVAGAHFYLLRGAGAQLQRALIAWMLDVHREQGYEEVYPPVLVKSEMLVGTGQLPKFASTMFHAEGMDLWMIPTAEVPVTNMYRGEILEVSALPLLHSAYSPCFRNEQFSAGRDVRGIMRGYQFDKVEMVQFVEPERSWDALESLLADAVEVVRRLGFRYRVVQLASSDLSFASAMTYDIEVWAPGCGEWLEVSSVSNFLDFQARRAGLRYRAADGTARYLHTLNGSGLALPRTVATLLEQCQRADGSVEVPAMLRPYLGGLSVIEPPSKPRRGRAATPGA
ncbi:MAG: serine--tRNA ligase [Dehalococcoidia bacterium]|nr:serine--tRNA ligase [Dehalococcoidia bacterium]